MIWSIYKNPRPDDYDDWEKDYSTDIPDGEYILMEKSFDYRNIDAYPYTSLPWESKIPVVIKNGEFNPKNIDAAAEDIHEQTGYWGVYIEKLTFSETGQIELHLGS